MNFLIIDTSGQDSSIALIKKEGTLFTLSIPLARQSIHLLPSIRSLLEEHDLSLSDLSFIAIGIGPGSFTGTRVGVMTAKTLSYGKNIPLIPFCSLMRFIPHEGSFISIVDAKSPGFYVLSGVKTDLGASFENSSKLVTEKELALLLENGKLALSPDKKRIEERLGVCYPNLQEAKSNFSEIISFSKKQYLSENTVFHKDVEVVYLSNSPVVY